MKLDTVLKELRKDNWLTGITFIEDNRDFLQALVDETEKQLSLNAVGCSLPSKEEIKQEANKYSNIDGIICEDERWVIDRNEAFIDGADFVINYKER